MRLEDLRTRARRLTNLLLVTGLALGLAACDEDGGGTPTIPSSGRDVAFLRVAHLAPDAGPVTVVVNEGAAGGFQLDGVEFGTFSAFREVPATFDGAEYSVKVRAGGTDVIDEVVTIERGDVVTVAAIGSGDPTLASFRGDLDRNETQATVTFVHAAPSVGTVTVSPPGIQTPPLFGPVSFGEVSGRPVRLAQARYDLQVRDAESGAVAAIFADLLLMARTVYTVWAVETPEGGVAALVTTDVYDPEATTTEVRTVPAASSDLRIAHLAAEAPTVNVLVDGEAVPALQGVDYKVVSGALNLTSALHRVQVFDAAADPVENPDDALIDVEVFLDANTDYTVAAIGDPDTGVDAGAAVLPYRGERPTEPGTALVRLLHASSRAFDIDLTLSRDVGGTPETLQPLPTVATGGGFSGFASIPAGTWDVEIRLPALGNFLSVTAEDVTFAEGSVSTLAYVGIAGQSLEVVVLDEAAPSR